MWIICQADDSHEISRLVFFEKLKKNIFQNVVWCSCDWRLVTLSVRLILSVCILRVYYNGKEFAPFSEEIWFAGITKKKKKKKKKKNNNKKTPIQIYRKFHLKKTWKFSDKISDIFHISAQNIDCLYSLEPPRRGGSNEYP